VQKPKYTYSKTKKPPSYLLLSFITPFLFLFGWSYNKSNTTLNKTKQQKDQIMSSRRKSLLQCPVCFHVFNTQTTLNLHVEKCLQALQAPSTSSLSCTSCDDIIKNADHYKCSICPDMPFCRRCNSMGRSNQTNTARPNHTSKHHIITVSWSSRTINLNYKNNDNDNKSNSSNITSSSKSSNRSHNDTNLTTIKCKRNHPLKQIITVVNGQICDQCEVQYPKASILHQCYRCNYDICNACVLANQTAPKKQNGNRTNGMETLRSQSNASMSSSSSSSSSLPSSPIVNVPEQDTVACPICLGDLADNDDDVGTMDSCVSFDEQYLFL